jgi:hypothetical protein
MRTTPRTSKSVLPFADEWEKPANPSPRISPEHDSASPPVSPIDGPKRADPQGDLADPVRRPSQQAGGGDRSCLVLGRDNRIRCAVTAVVRHRFFDRGILFVIVLNSLMLALTDNSRLDANGAPSASASARNAAIETAELFFTPVFTVECVLKITAMGFVGGAGSYLSDGWNWLDFLVVAGGLMALVPGVPNVSVLRAFRVLRPLRSLRALPKLKVQCLEGSAIPLQVACRTAGRAEPPFWTNHLQNHQQHHWIDMSPLHLVYTPLLPAPRCPLPAAHR